MVILSTLYYKAVVRTPSGLPYICLEGRPFSRQAMVKRKINLMIPG